jgi:hypothetical protein
MCAILSPETAAFKPQNHTESVMSDLSRIDERLSQVVELLRCLLAEIRKTRQALEEDTKSAFPLGGATPPAEPL